MQHICDFHSLMSSLRSMPGRRRVAVACPSDAHTGYAITRALDEGTADFVLACCGAAAWPIDDVCSRHAGRVELLSAPTPDEAARTALTGRNPLFLEPPSETDPAPTPKRRHFIGHRGPSPAGAAPLASIAGAYDSRKETH